MLVSFARCSEGLLWRVCSFFSPALSPGVGLSFFAVQARLPPDKMGILGGDGRSPTLPPVVFLFFPPQCFMSLGVCAVLPISEIFFFSVVHT